MQSKFNPLLTILFAITLISCSSDKNRHKSEEQGGDSANQISVTLELRVPQIANLATRSLTAADENHLDNIVALIFLEESEGIEHYAYLSHASYIDNMAGERTKQMRIILQKSTSSEKYRIVLLANLENEVATAFAQLNKEGIDPKTLAKTELLKRVTFVSDRVWNSSKSEGNPQDFRPLPMWGESLGCQVITSSTTGNTLGTIALLRSVARIDIGLNMSIKDGEIVTDGLGEKFRIKTAHIYNAMPRGLAVPDMAKYIAKKASLPDEVSALGFPSSIEYLLEDEFTGSKPGQTSGFIQSIYLSESDIKSFSVDGLKRTCIIIGGYYSSDEMISQGKPNITTESWYRIDFFDPNPATGSSGFIDILRNHRYWINIMGISGPGYSTPAEAFNYKPIDIETVIDAWDESNNMNEILTDGQFQIVVDKSEFKFFKEGREQNLTLFCDHPEGWEIESDTRSEWITTNPSSGSSGIETSVSIVIEPLMANTQSREGKFVIKSANLRKTIHVKQTTESELTITLSEELIIFRKSGSSPKSINIVSYPPNLIRYASDVGDIRWVNGAAPADLNGTVNSSFLFQPTANSFDRTLHSIVTIWIKEGDNVVSKNLIVRQLASDLLFRITGKLDYYAAEGGMNLNFLVESETSWQMTGLPDDDPDNMLTLSSTTEQTSTLTPTPYYFDLTPNPHYDRQRKALIAVSSSDPEFPNQKIEIHQKAEPPTLALNGISDDIMVDFGTPTNNNQQSEIVVSSNSGWVALSASAQTDLISNWTPALDMVQSGSTVPYYISEKSIIILSQSSYQGQPAAGTELSESFSIETRNHGSASPLSRIVTIRRKVQPVWHLANISPTSGTSLNHEGEIVTLTAETNAAWTISSNSANSIKVDATPYDINKIVSITIPKNSSWENPRMVTISASEDGKSPSQVGAYSQPGYSLEYADYSNVPESIPPKGGNYMVRTRTETATPPYRLGSALGDDSQEWLWLPEENQASADVGLRGIHVPAMPNSALGWSDRRVSLRMQAQEWVTMMNRTQKGYTLNYDGQTDLPNPIPKEGGEYWINMATSTSAPNFKIAIHIDNQAPIETSAGQIGKRYFTIPSNDSGSIRVISIKYQKSESWEDAITTRQSGNL